jgi:CRISPR-associated exonuclease Cas4
MPYSEDDLIQLSSLQHFAYCKRQCALIHIEMLWEENVLTAEGRVMHEKVDSAKPESRGDIRIQYGLPICSLELGLVGKADVVEFHKTDCGKWIPFPVEYKHGKPKNDNCDKVQLCAQAMCLEEMLSTQIQEGALFYGKTRKREDVLFNDSLRDETKRTALEVRVLFEKKITPQPEYSPKCDQCSLFNLCLPKKEKNISRYLMKARQD